MTEQNNLSGREIEILQLVAKGLTNREIAQKLFISPNTVKVHLSNIFGKISVASRTEATLYGIEHGFVDVPGSAEVQPPEQAGWLQQLRQRAWIVVSLIVLVAALMVSLVFNVLKPALPTEEEQALAELAQRWQELAPLPAARAGMAAVAYNGEIYAIAGEGPQSVSGSVFRYTPETNSWAQLSDKPTPVTDVHAVLIGEKLYVPGGLGGDGRPTDSLEIYDPRRDTWSVGARLPKAISAYALADFEGQMYLFGGWDGKRALDDVYVYDPGADEWRVRTPVALARRDHGAVAMTDKIIVLGGRNSAGALADAVSYYPSRDANGKEHPWEGFTDLPESRYGFGVGSSGEAIFIFGGLDSPELASNFPLLLQFTDSGWRSIFIEIDGPIFKPALISSGSQIFILSPEPSVTPTSFLKYQAIYFEIFLPIIR
ncbi:MAG: winged helix-turn-helix transcriptional regulator [Chloroflexi bacterium]|nr:winged helix-turn-helix transcriptional regulator [Chloroflexota bacterium]